MSKIERPTGPTLGEHEAVPEALDARAVKILEVREALRGSVGTTLKGRALQNIEAVMESASCTIRVAACENQADFLRLFALHDIGEDLWRNSGKLRDAGYQSLYKAIRAQFREQGGWEGFIAFMPPPAKQAIDASILRLSQQQQVAACETREDFLALFVLHGISEDTWRTARKLCDAGYWGAYAAISDRFREQGGWEGFIAFMPAPAKSTIDESVLKLPATAQVAACETPKDFLALFALHGISEQVWRKSKEMKGAGYASLQRAIVSRFRDQGGWRRFLALMPAPAKREIDASILKLSQAQQVAACETPGDFLALFALHGISEETWRSSGKLGSAGYKGLCGAIFDHFRGGWGGFIGFMDGKDEETLEAKLEALNVEDAVALLAHQPSKLKAYLAIAHPELSPEEVDLLVGHSFKRLHNRRTYDYSDFKNELEAPQVMQFPRRTADAAACVGGLARGADCVLIEGDVSTRRVKTAEDGTFAARIPLDIGARNTLRIVPVNHDKKQVGPAAEVVILQTGEPDDIDALVALLGQMGTQAVDSIKTDPGRQEYVVRQTEQVLIRKFSGKFAKGKDYVAGLIAKTDSPAVRKVLRTVLSRFTKIDKMEHPNVKKGAPLYFFQKYCIAEIQRAMEEGKNGMVLANDPGLGKTRTALVAVNGDPATIITPNSVVSSWTEEAQRALLCPDLLVLQNMHSRQRKEALRETTAQHCVTNVEFLRAAQDDERYELLSNAETIVIQDEAHGLLNLGSEQSKGARRLQHKFLLLLSATPAKDPKTLRRILHLLEPDDPRFSSDKAFAQAFPGNDPKALKTLSLLKQQYMIRFTKEDVLETMDPRLPISQQKHRLPKKEYVPEEQMGCFTLTDDQCEAMYELFLDFHQWTQDYDRYVPKDAIAHEDQLRGNSNALVKTHALRQTANNPSYVGSAEPDPKAAEMLRTVEAFLAEGRKVVIFCQYNAQALKYAELLRAHCPSVYTGLTSKQGLRTGADEQPLRYRKNTHGAWVMDGRGLPQEDPNGEPMSALDYERLAFQNAAERRVMISTYAAGSVGVTFTAGKATIFDDLPDDVVKEIQAEDRTHRIDHEHQTHHSVKYVRMVARYPESFLEKMKRVWVRKKPEGSYDEVSNRRIAEKEGLETAYDTFFAQGTYDEVRLAGLATQRTRFRLINDGIEDASELPEIAELAV